MFLLMLLLALAPSHRIVSVAPSITEILFALGVGDQVVGDTTYCNFPEAARAKPKVGGYTTPSLEAILALRPDQVIMMKNRPRFCPPNRGNLKRMKSELTSALTMNLKVGRASRLPSERVSGSIPVGFAAGGRRDACPTLPAARFRCSKRDWFRGILAPALSPGTGCPFLIARRFVEPD